MEEELKSNKRRESRSVIGWFSVKNTDNRIDEEEVAMSDPKYVDSPIEVVDITFSDNVVTKEDLLETLYESAKDAQTWGELQLQLALVRNRLSMITKNRVLGTSCSVSHVKPLTPDTTR